MTDVETLEERVSTVERAVSDGDHEFPAVDDLAALVERLEAVERELAALEERTDELDAATQALRGYVGNVRSVNERVEQRADTALAATERLERRLDAVERETRDAGGDGAGRAATDDTGRETTTTDETVRETAGSGELGTATTRRRGSLDGTERAAPTPSTDSQTSESRDAGVLEQIRSLL